LTHTVGRQLTLMTCASAHLAALSVRPACGYLPSRRASPPLDRSQFVLLGELHGVNNLPRVITRLRSDWGLNPRFLDGKSDAVRLLHTGAAPGWGGGFRGPDPPPRLDHRHLCKSRKYGEFFSRAWWGVGCC